MKFKTHQKAREYIEEHGLRATVTPGVFVRRCEGCDHFLHHDVPDGVVFHSERVEGPDRDGNGQWGDSLRVWREMRP